MSASAATATPRRSTEPRPEIEVLLFGVVAVSVSWLLWAPLVAARWRWIDGASAYWHLAGGLGPAVAALVMTTWFEGRRGVEVLARRAVTGPIRWLAAAVAVPFVTCLIALAAARLGGVPVDLSRVGASKEFPHLPLAAYWIANVVFYGYGEEIGWRGFALPRLQRRRSALRASLWLSALWGLWHIPLFVFSAGLRDMPAVGVVGWASSMVTGSILCTWLFNSTRGSIAVVALFHAALDIFIGSPTGGAVLANAMGAAVVIGALVIPWRYGRPTLSSSPKVTDEPPAH